jgi:hypothetical protein
MSLYHSLPWPIVQRTVHLWRRGLEEKFRTLGPWLSMWRDEGESHGTDTIVCFVPSVARAARDELGARPPFGPCSVAFASLETCRAVHRSLALENVFIGQPVVLGRRPKGAKAEKGGREEAGPEAEEKGEEVVVLRIALGAVDIAKAVTSALESTNRSNNRKGEEKAEEEEGEEEGVEEEERSEEHTSELQSLTSRC